MFLWFSQYLLFFGHLSANFRTVWLRDRIRVSLKALQRIQYSNTAETQVV